MKQLQSLKNTLATDLYEQLNNIQDELDDSWHKRQIFRTDTEARYAVLNDFKFPTNAAKYWQAVREQCVHFDELTRLSFDMRRKRIDLDEVQDKLDKLEKLESETGLSAEALAQAGYDKKRLEVDRDELLFSLASGTQVAKDRVREIVQWSQIKKEVNDGSFDDKNVNTHQKESLFRSVLNRAQVAPKDISAEERLSIEGILHSLKEEPVNKSFIERLQTQRKEENESKLANGKATT